MLSARALPVDENGIGRVGPFIEVIYYGRIIV